MAINIGYFMSESIQSFRRNWVMSLGAVITIYLSLLLVGASLASSMIVGQVVRSVEEKVSIRVFLKDGAAPADVDAMNKALVADARVKDVTYTSKEKALEEFKLTMADSPEIIDQLEVNPLPASLDVDLEKPQDVTAVVEMIKANPNFIKVADRPDDPEKSLKYGQQIVNQLFAFTRVLRAVGVVFIVMLAVISLIFINNTIRIAIYARRKEIGIMRLVGASNWFIRTPFLLEGTLQSLLGAFLALLTLGSIQWFVMPKVKEIISFMPVSLSVGSSVQISLILVLSGVIIGLAGSAVALRRYLKV
ncbi:MAG: ABC transporter permease [Actinobacteria bacterium HGW-Actinobacteria-6]|jgi:cell division transport system permease protein|nr:MAG: ABC transporter permease [Actinobacteria bacterium HGW-Actinobacteria-6]